MKPDISTREDIRLLVHQFYDQVKTDSRIGFFFSEVVTIDWDKHLEKMCAFWENVLFFTGEYEGNPLETHRRLNQVSTTRPEHFQRWMQLFDAAVDEHFSGPNADKVKQHSKAIAAVMMQKM